jgi:hypothetical protein
MLAQKGLHLTARLFGTAVYPVKTKPVRKIESEHLEGMRRLVHRESAAKTARLRRLSVVARMV